MTKLDRTDRFMLVILFAVTALLYARTVWFPFVDFDDNKYITENQHLKLGLSTAGVHWALTTGYFANWHPVTWLTYLGTYSLFGAHAGPFHAVNVILQSLNACLLFYFLKQSTGRSWPAFFAAALWAWHPLRVESVAWVSETKDMLSVFFWMLTLIAYVRYARASSHKWYIVVTITFLMALASKSTVVTLPAILLLMDYWPLRRLDLKNGAGLRRMLWLILEKIPWLLMSVAVSVIVYRVQGFHRALYFTQVIPLSVRLENAAVSVIQYIWRCFWPFHLAIFYPHPALIGQKIPIWQWAGSLLLLLVLTVWTTARRRTQRFLLVGWLWFLGTLAPTLGFVQAGEQAMADRYSLIPSIGLIVAIVWSCIPNDSASETAPRMRYKIIAICAVLILCGNLAISWRQISFWRNTRTLFSHADAVVPNNYMAKSIVANDLIGSGGDLKQALSLSKSAVYMCPARPLLHYVYARALEKNGKDKPALKEYLIAANLDRENASIRNDLGGLLITVGRDKDALDQFRAAVHLDPDLADAQNNLAVLLDRQGDLDEAISHWWQAVRLEPSEGVYHGLLADALRSQGQRAQAIGQYIAAIAAGEHRPDWESSLAWFVATDPNSSIDLVRKIVPIAQDACEQTHGQDPLALDALAAALARCGRFDDAIVAAQRAMQCAQSGGKTALAKSIEIRLNLYRSGTAYVLRWQE